MVKSLETVSANVSLPKGTYFAEASLMLRWSLAGGREEVENFEEHFWRHSVDSGAP